MTRRSLLSYAARPDRTTRAIAAAVGLLLLGVVIAAGLDALYGGDEPRPAGTSSPSASESPSPTSTPSRAARPPRPRAGACYPLSYQEALAPTTEVAAVPCRRRHTATTYYVGTLDTVVDGHLLAVDSKRVQDAVAADCPRRLPRFLGGTPTQLRLSVLRSVWFSPTLEQSDAGQNWYRCDVIALGGPDRLAPLDATVAGLLRRTDQRRRYAVCGTAEPGRRGFERVSCGQRHRWRAISAYDVPEASYPGKNAVTAIAQRRCKDAARAVAKDSLNYQWGYDWPTAEQWATGQHFGLCWAPD